MINSKKDILDKIKKITNKNCQFYQIDLCNKDELKEVFKKHFKVGTATTVAEISPKTTQKLILKHFNSITPGNELKPESILDKASTLHKLKKLEIILIH